jgi:hypothetical protein
MAILAAGAHSEILESSVEASPSLTRVGGIQKQDRLHP